jgi:hypothetical protein
MRQPVTNVNVTTGCIDVGRCLSIDRHCSRSKNPARTLFSRSIGKCGLRTSLPAWMANLDPNSVFEELVPHFRDARKRRQVVIVTHDVNVVVNTDADQVIVATSVRKIGGGLPEIDYQAGSLENTEIRGLVCQILEGGDRAFLERERRYRLRWGQNLLEEP